MTNDQRKLAFDTALNFLPLDMRQQLGDRRADDDEDARETYKRRLQEAWKSCSPFWQEESFKKLVQASAQRHKHAHPTGDSGRRISDSAGPRQFHDSVSRPVGSLTADGNGVVMEDGTIYHGKFLCSLLRRQRGGAQ